LSPVLFLWVYVTIVVVLVMFLLLHIGLLQIWCETGNVCYSLWRLRHLYFYHAAYCLQARYMQRWFCSSVCTSSSNHTVHCVSCYWFYYINLFLQPVCIACWF